MLCSGERVEEGDVIFTLLADGVTHNILSPVTGLTDTIEVDEGDRVIAGMILAGIIQVDEKERAAAGASNG